MTNDKVVWRECTACSRSWPFPYADSPTSNAREWLCQACSAAETAALHRTLQNIMQILGPESVCECQGCAWETDETLRLIRQHGIDYIDRKRTKPAERKGNEI